MFIDVQRLLLQLMLARSAVGCLGVCFVFFFILLKFTSNVSLADLGPVGASRECHRLPSGALDPVPDLLPGGLHASLLLPTPDLNDSCF